MKKLPFLLLCLFCNCVSAQSDNDPIAVKELDVFGGLMYAPADMQQLKRMADSLQFQFKQCKSPSSFTAWHQAPALCFRIRVKGSVKALIADLEKNIDLDTLKTRYKDWIVEPPFAAVLAHNEHAFLAGNGSRFDKLYPDTALFETWSRLPRGGWVYSTSAAIHSIRGEFNIISAWQLQDVFHAPVIPETYGRLIGYVDCLVDNTTKLMLPGNRSLKGGEYFYLLQKHVFQKTSRRVLMIEELTDEDLGNYVCAHYGEDERVRYLTDEILLDGMERFAVGNFAKFVEGAVPKERLLELKRSAQVFGFCSMDTRPREHARDIAVLASQTHQWPVFIKAHLNIMNDYMDRTSDGSYAQAGRKTYLKELDALSINTTDLLLGSAMRASNTVPGHYFGDVGRYGRALSETKDPLAFENRLKKMLKDPLLDDFNKILLFRLYASYCYNQPSRKKIVEKVKNLQKEAEQYPELISKGISELRTDLREY